MQQKTNSSKKGLPLENCYCAVHSHKSWFLFHHLNNKNFLAFMYLAMCCCATWWATSLKRYLWHNIVMLLARTFLLVKLYLAVRLLLLIHPYRCLSIIFKNLFKEKSLKAFSWISFNSSPLVNLWVLNLFFNKYRKWLELNSTDINGY